MDDEVSTPSVDSDLNTLFGDRSRLADRDGGDVQYVEVPITVHGTVIKFPLPASATVLQLSESLAQSLSIDSEKQKLLITPKPGILKFPFPDTPLSAIYTPKTKITLLGSTQKEISDLNASIHNVQARSQQRLTARRDAPKATRHRDWKQLREDIIYTFQTIEPLPYLAKPDRARRYLKRLADDPGIKAVMRSHRFSVGLLTEMNPAEHTSHESRTLGLNRNGGEVIELRLRTDRYDGYRDYKVIRKTLCHELAHNVFGEHDRNFWDLTGQIEREVERNDWRHGGHKLGEDEFYNPEDKGYAHGEEQLDDGGWTGGEFVLGSHPDSNGSQGLSRREILAKAAMERIGKQQQAEKDVNEEGGNG